MTGQEFKSIRLKLHLTQSELGAIMGMRAQEISRIESGARKPTKKDVAFILYIEKHPPEELRKAK